MKLAVRCSSNVNMDYDQAHYSFRCGHMCLIKKGAKETVCKCASKFFLVNGKDCIPEIDLRPPTLPPETTTFTGEQFSVDLDYETTTFTKEQFSMDLDYETTTAATEQLSIDLDYETTASTTSTTTNQPTNSIIISSKDPLLNK